MASINLTWVDNSNDELGFHIYRSIDGAAESLLSDALVNVSAFTDLNTLPGTYIYSVSSFNAAGESARVASNTVVVPAVVPAAPSDVVATLVP